MQRKKLHKTLLILVLVLVPPYFLTLTDEGTRVSDNVVLWLFNKEAINLDFKALDSGFRAQEIKKVFPELTWQCGEESTAFGNSLCTAEIGSVNDFPSRYLSTFYFNNRLSALKIRYRQRYHDQILGHLIEQLGQPENVEQAIKDMELVSRQTGFTMHELKQWRDRYALAGKESLKSHPKDVQDKELEKRDQLIAKLALENEILKKARAITEGRKS